MLATKPPFFITCTEKYCLKGFHHLKWWKMKNGKATGKG